jgi:uncharacterized protein (TIGR02466 family)
MIKRDDLWPTPIWHFDVPYSEVTPQSIEAECYNFKHKNNRDWRNDSLYPNINKMLAYVEDMSQTCFKELGVKDSLPKQLENFWININSPGRFNKPHLHPGTLFSGVYYVKTDDDTGPISFHNQTDKDFILQFYTDKPNQFNISTVSYKPIIGRVVIFPSWVSHSVDPNQSNQDRISISFDFN